VRRLRVALFLLGLLTLIALIWHIGPGRILDATAALGPAALLVILLPSCLMYVVEAFGWRLTMGRHASQVSFWRLLVIRTAGELVNMTTPAAYVGGEPLKAYLLKRHQIPMVDAAASVVIAKTTMTIAQVGFILLGIAVGLWLLQASGSPGRTILAAVAGVGLLLFGTVLFVVVQRRGLFMGILGLLRACGVRIPFLEAREQNLQALDWAILNFYIDHRPQFLLSTGAFFLGWLAEALEVYAMLYCLGASPDVPGAIAIAALSVFIKGGTFFIPGSLGAQEGGNLAVLLAFGYSDVLGMAFALLRRLRELVWIAIGLGCLGAMGGSRESEN
jgi:uncharacterized protein (TIRG00374 family)